MIDSSLLRSISTSEINKKFLKKYIMDVRGTEDESVADDMTEYLASRGVFYTPMDTYLQKVFGKDVYKDFREYYSNGKCVLTKKLAIPLETLDERFIGLVLHDTITQGKYKYPMGEAFSKETYLQMTRHSFEKAMEVGYIIIVEGVFDELSLASMGEPVVGLSGPTLSKKSSSILDLIPVKIVCSDEDSAGKEMFVNCNNLLTGQVVSTKLPCKDIDRYLRSKKNRETFKDVIKYNRELGWIQPLIKFEE